MWELRFFSYWLPGLYFPWLTRHLWCRYALVRFRDETLHINRSCVATTAKKGTQTRRFNREYEEYILSCWYIKLWDWDFSLLASLVTRLTNVFQSGIRFWLPYTKLDLIMFFLSVTNKREEFGSFGEGCGEWIWKSQSSNT